MARKYDEKGKKKEDRKDPPSFELGSSAQAGT